MGETARPVPAQIATSLYIAYRSGPYHSAPLAGLEPAPNVVEWGRDRWKDGEWWPRVAHPATPVLTGQREGPGHTNSRRPYGIH